MYAVIQTGGKQYKVEQGERVEVERVGSDVGSEVELRPVLLVDGDTVLATPGDLAGAVVKATVVDATRGPKIDGFVYKPKSNNRRRYGHRQVLSVLEITAIDKGRARARSSATETAGNETTGTETAGTETAGTEAAAAEPETPEES
jgi:large subunit ribosomal protein L21